MMQDFTVGKCLGKFVLILVPGLENGMTEYEAQEACRILNDGHEHDHAHAAEVSHEHAYPRCHCGQNMVPLHTWKCVSTHCGNTVKP